MQIMREVNGRIVGKFDEWFPNLDEDDNWEDYKVSEVRFPQHREEKVYPVTITYIKPKLNTQI